ncbi:MAG: SOS response-associated peptidase [Anaerolineaceae bacterium]
MCGRFTMTDEQLEPLARDLGVPVESLPHIRPRFNIAPTNQHYIVRVKAEQAELLEAYWGLVNSWAKDSKRAAQQINARAETLATRPGFREAFHERRCVVPADGFYEWTGPKDNRQPLWFHRPEGGLVYFAALYESWQPHPGEWQRTFTIVTTGANDLLARYHDRMPVILPPDAAYEWMDPKNTDTVRLQHLLVPAAESVLVARPVSRKVNNVRYNEPDAIEEEPRPPGGE